MSKIFENVVAIVGGLITGTVVSALLPFFLFPCSTEDVLELQVKKQNIEVRLQDECRVVRSAAKYDTEWYNDKVNFLQTNNKKVFIGSFISDAVDALELIEID